MVINMGALSLLFAGSRQGSVQHALALRLCFECLQKSFDLELTGIGINAVLSHRCVFPKTVH